MTIDINKKYSIGGTEVHILAIDGGGSHSVVVLTPGNGYLTRYNHLGQSQSGDFPPLVEIPPETALYLNFRKGYAWPATFGNNADAVRDWTHPAFPSPQGRVKVVIENNRVKSAEVVA